MDAQLGLLDYAKYFPFCDTVLYMTDSMLTTPKVYLYTISKFGLFSTVPNTLFETMAFQGLPGKNTKCFKLEAIQ